VPAPAAGAAPAPASLSAAAAPPGGAAAAAAAAAAGSAGAGAGALSAGAAAACAGGRGGAAGAPAAGAGAACGTAADAEEPSELGELAMADADEPTPSGLNGFRPIERLCAAARSQLLAGCTNVWFLPTGSRMLRLRATYLQLDSVGAGTVGSADGMRMLRCLAALQGTTGSAHGGALVAEQTERQAACRAPSCSPGAV